MRGVLGRPGLSTQVIFLHHPPQRGSAYIEILSRLGPVPAGVFQGFEQNLFLG